jgi:carbonic anhydrase
MSDEILRRSTALRREFFEQQGELLERLRQEGQSPEALFVGCSDARLTPESLLGAQPGDLFMLRNIANIVPPYIQTEMGATSVLEYAVLHLQVPHIIICGHTDCAGIRALDTQLDLVREPALSRWLELARPAQRDVDFGLRDLSAAERHEAIVQRNVLNQLKNVESYPFIRQALEADRLELHGWVYDLDRQVIRFFDPITAEFVTLDPPTGKLS